MQGKDSRGNFALEPYWVPIFILTYDALVISNPV